MPGFTTPRTWTDAEFVTAAIMNPHIRDNLNFIRPLPARKAADQSIASNTSLQNATDMVLPIGVSETWWYHLAAVFTVPGAPDMKVHWATPSGATGHHWIVGDGVSNRDVIANDLVVAGTGGGMTMDLYATVINSTTAGNVQFQFAQFASDASAVVMLANAVLIGQRIA